VKIFSVLTREFMLMPYALSFFDQQNQNGGGRKQRH